MSSTIMHGTIAPKEELDRYKIEPAVLPEITSPDELKVGEYYALIDKGCGQISISRLEETHGDIYFENRHWAYKENPQAFARWVIRGPIELNLIPHQSTILGEMMKLQIQDRQAYKRTLREPYEKLGRRIAEYFTSGNDVPVSRITLNREQIAEFLANIEAQKLQMKK